MNIEDLWRASDNVITIKWNSCATPTNESLTPENITSAGPCSDPDCPICAPSDGSSYTPHTTDEEPTRT
jgi:hypothetical protein